MVKFFGREVFPTEKRALPKGAVPANQNSDSYNALISSVTASLSTITEEEALKIPSVANSLEIITSTIAQLPFYLYRELPNGDIEKVKDDPRVFLLNNEPNEAMSGIQLKKRIVRDYLLYGASYNKVEKDLNEITAIYNLPVDKILVKKYVQDGYKYWAEINLLDASVSANVTFDASDLLIFLKDTEDGFTSKGILHTHAEVLHTALDETSFTSNILRNGALPLAVLQAASRLSEKAIARLQESFSKNYSGSRNTGKTIILEDGLEYKPVSLKPNEMELTNVKKTLISEVARMFNIPESLINSSANKYNSNEQNSIHLLQYCLSPILVNIESSLDKTLLLEDEKQDGYFWRADTSEIIRVTEKEKIEAVAAGVKSGLVSYNEGRGKLDLPALENDYFAWSLGQVFFDPKEKKLIIPNMGQTVDMENLQTLIKEDNKTDEEGDTNENENGSQI